MLRLNSFLREMGARCLAPDVIGLQKFYKARSDIKTTVEINKLFYSLTLKPSCSFSSEHLKQQAKILAPHLGDFHELNHPNWVVSSLRINNFLLFDPGVSLHLTKEDTKENMYIRTTRNSTQVSRSPTEDGMSWTMS